MNCLWFYLLPINFYLTNGFSQGYPNYLLGNSHNPYQFSPPTMLPMGFFGVVIWFAFFSLATAFVIRKKFSSFSDERVFKYLAVLIGGFSLSLFISFLVKGEGDFYFLWYFLVIAAVCALYEYWATKQPKIKNTLALCFALLFLLPLWYRCFASFYLGWWFYVLLALIILGAAFYCAKCLPFGCSGISLKFLILYLIVPAGIFLLFFYPRPESTITPAHTANMYYFPYDSIYHGRVAIRDYPVIFRGFLTDTGFIGFFKIFGVSVYKANIFLRLTEPFTLVILYFLLLRMLPWYFVFLCLILMRTNYLWLNFTAFTANWPTQIRTIYPDLLLLAFVVFLQERKRVFLFFTAAFLPLALLNSPDFGYSIILSAVVTISAIVFLEKKLIPAPQEKVKNEEKVFLAIFILALAAFWFILFCLFISIKLIFLDYLFIALFLPVSILLLLRVAKGKNSSSRLRTPAGIILCGLFVSLCPFVYYLLRINSLGTFLFLALRMPFTQMSIKAVAEAHFIPLFSYSPPVLGKDIGYFMLWHLPPIITLSCIMFAAYLLFVKKEANRSLAYILIFLSICSLMAYPRSMVLSEMLKMIFSMRFALLLLIVLLYHGIIFLNSRKILLYGLLLINFIPTLPLFTSGTIRDENLMTNYNNFYVTTLDAELNYLRDRNVSKEYLAGKFKGYFGNLQWFKDNDEDLYRSCWAEEAMRISRKNFGWEKQAYIDKTIWPRKDWRAHIDVEPVACLGKTITAGAWIKVEEPQRVRIFIVDGSDSIVFSPYHKGNDEWEFLKVTKEIKTYAPFVKVGVEVKKGRVIFREENGPAALRIGQFNVAEGRDMAPPADIKTIYSMLGFLFQKVYGGEVNSYKDSDEN